MAEDHTARQMSLVPYTSDNREILLQQGSAIVVYDDQSRQLSVRSADQTALELVNCPTCHRPLHDDYRPGNSHERYDEQYPQATSFVDPDYFSMLAQSRRTSPAGSSQDTPSLGPRRFYQPALRSGRSRDVSGSQAPSNAEFVASEPVAGSSQGISSSAFSPGYFKQFFREERELGRGGNGVVLLVEHLLDGVSLGHFACKRIPVGDDHRWLEKVLIEVKLLSQLPHKNLVKYHWVWVEEYQPSNFGPKIPCVWILQEYCNGGDLHNHVLGPRDIPSTEKLKARHRRQSRGQAPAPDNLRSSRLSLEEIISFFRDITSGLHHLHSRGYIHRDVKPSNCLLQHSEGRVRVLLSDFGEVQASGTRRSNTGATGTISYCAPEVLRQTSDGRFGDFTTKSDIFSLGMIVYFMCFGKLPYINVDDLNEEDEDLDLLREEITKWPGFRDEARSRPDLPERLYKYLQRLLSVNPSDRPSTDDILASIKASTDFADVKIAAEPRGPSVDSSGQRRASFLGRIGRSKSGDQVARSPSPIKRPTDDLADATSLRLRSRLVDRPTSRSPQLSPRLMLPPPPATTSWLTALQEFFQQPAVRFVWRYGFWTIKLVSIFLPCWPFVPDPLLLLALLTMAHVDLCTDPIDHVFSLVLLFAHFATIGMANSLSSYCHNDSFVPLATSTAIA